MSPPARLLPGEGGGQPVLALRRKLPWPTPSPPTTEDRWPQSNNLSSLLSIPPAKGTVPMSPRNYRHWGEECWRSG